MGYLKKQYEPEIRMAAHEARPDPSDPIAGGMVRGRMIEPSDLERMLADRGLDLPGVAFGDPTAMEIVAWHMCRLIETHDEVRVTMLSVMRRRHVDEDGTAHQESMDSRTLSFTPDEVRLVEVNHRRVNGNPRRDEPTILWRIEDEEGEGPFRSPFMRRRISLAATDGEDNGWTNDLPLPCEEGLDMHGQHLCAVADRASLGLWFPTPVRRLLGNHGYSMVRIRADAGAAQVGETQAVYDTTRSEVLSRRMLIGTD